jgi:tRNA(fMet)-specific endonuclease VapC
MQYLLDTDWVIHCLHGVLRVTSRPEQLMREGVGLGTVSMAELYQGVFFSTDPQGNERALRDMLAGIDIMPLDDEVCRIFGRERGRLRAAGTPIGDFDLLIGSTALRHDLTLLTNNRRHFERLQGLSILSV